MSHVPQQALCLTDLLSLPSPCTPPFSTTPSSFPHHFLLSGRPSLSSSQHRAQPYSKAIRKLETS